MSRASRGAGPVRAVEGPPLDAAWEEIVRRQCLSSHDKLERVLAGAEMADSLTELSRQARIRTTSLRGVVTWFGLADVKGKASGQPVHFPPANRQRRIGILRRGQYPDDARALDWWRESDGE